MENKENEHLLFCEFPGR